MIGRATLLAIVGTGLQSVGQPRLRQSDIGIQVMTVQVEAGELVHAP